MLGHTALCQVDEVSSARFHLCSKYKKKKFSIKMSGHGLTCTVYITLIPK